MCFYQKRCIGQYTKWRFFLSPQRIGYTEMKARIRILQSLPNNPWLKKGINHLNKSIQIIPWMKSFRQKFRFQNELLLQWLNPKKEILNLVKIHFSFDEDANQTVDSPLNKIKLSNCSTRVVYLKKSTNDV